MPRVAVLHFGVGGAMERSGEDRLRSRLRELEAELKTRRRLDEKRRIDDALAERSRLLAEEEHALLTTLVRGARAAIIATDLDGIIKAWNPRASEFYGYGESEAVGNSIDIVTPTERRDELKGLLASIRRGEAFEQLAFERLRSDGSLLQVDVSLSALKDRRGRVFGASFIERDLSEQRRMETALSQERELLARLLDTIPVMITIYDPEMQSFRFNTAFRETLGWTEGDAQSGDLMFKAYPDPEERERAARHMLSLDPGWKTLRVSSSSGEVVDSEWANIPLPDGRQVGVGIDIRWRLQAERERERLLAELDATINSAATGIVIFDKNLEVKRVNEAAKSMLGMSEEDLRESISTRSDWVQVRGTDGGLLSWDELPLFRAKRGEVVRDASLVMTLPEGREIAVMVTAAPIRTGDGEVIGVVLTGIDVTRLYQLQQRREVYTHSISHDLRLPLSVITGHAQLLDERFRLAQDRSLLESVESILRAASRIDLLVRDLVDAARISGGQLELNLERIEVKEFLCEMLFKNAAGLKTERVSIEGSLEELFVLADYERLERVVTNLLSNALKYSYEGSTVVLSVDAIGDRVEVTVRDRGPGIPKGVLKDLFEPFFRPSGRAGSEGMGLGLYISRLLIEAHGGSIYAESEPKVGSAFHFTVPRA